MASWCTHHIDHLTGVNEATRGRYRQYVANDIALSKIGSLPLTALTNADVAKWLNGLTGAAKTAANKRGLFGRWSQQCGAGQTHLSQPLRWQPATPRRTHRDGVPHTCRIRHSARRSDRAMAAAGAGSSPQPAAGGAKPVPCGPATLIWLRAPSTSGERGAMCPVRGTTSAHPRRSAVSAPSMWRPTPWASSICLASGSLPIAVGVAVAIPDPVRAHNFNPNVWAPALVQGQSGWPGPETPRTRLAPHQRQLADPSRGSADGRTASPRPRVHQDHFRPLRASRP